MIVDPPGPPARKAPPPAYNPPHSAAKKGSAHRYSRTRRLSSSPPPPRANPTPIRRILASRPSPTDNRKREYRIEWYPTWEPASSITRGQKTLIQEFEHAEGTGKTFSYRTGDGEVWSCLRDDVESENDSTESMGKVLANVVQGVKEEIGDARCAVKLGQMIEGCYEFKDEGARVVGEAGELLDCAWEVLRMGAVDMSRGAAEGGGTYGRVKVRFIGEVDAAMGNRSMWSRDGEEKRPAIKISKILAPVFDKVWDTLAVDPFCSDDKGTAASAIQRFREQASTLIQVAPFLLRGKSWVLTLSMLLFSTSELVSMLKEVGIKVTEHWTSHAREYLMQMYGEECDDLRAPHEIQESFLYLRDWFRESKSWSGEQHGEGDQVGRNEAAINAVQGVTVARGNHGGGGVQKRKRDDGEEAQTGRRCSKAARVEDAEDCEWVG